MGVMMECDKLTEMLRTLLGSSGTESMFRDKCHDVGLDWRFESILYFVP